jgi:uncharacterized RDD family membrane protein YckC
MAERLAASRFVTQARAASTSEEPEHASLQTRTAAYLIDSLVLFGFGMSFIAVGLIVLLISSDSGLQDPSDGAILSFVLVVVLMPPAWLALNLVFGLRRQQTLGQYILGLRIESEDGAPLTLRRLLLRLVALNPLTFHPLFAGFWFFLALVSILLVSSQAVYLACIAISLLCLAAPLVSFAFALTDPQRRGVHDWLAATKVVRLE